MTAAEELREVQSLIKAIESERSVTRLYLNDEERWDHERKRLQEIVDRWSQRLERHVAYREDGESMLEHWDERLVDLRKQVKHLQNKKKIEKLLALQDEINDLVEGITPEVLKNIQDMRIAAAVAEVQDEEAAELEADYERNRTR